MVNVNSCVYSLGEESGSTIHRVRMGERLFSVLYTETPTPACTFLEQGDCTALGVDLVVGDPGRTHRFIEAIRPGLGSSDDELVAKLSSWDDGRVEWLVPILPTPRGLVIAALMLSVHETRTTRRGVMSSSAMKRDNWSDTDDIDVLIHTFAFDADQATARRLRSWTSGSWTLIAGEPDEDDVAHVCTAVEAGRGRVGEVVVSRDDAHPRYFSWRFSPVRAEEPWESLPADLHRVAATARAAIWTEHHSAHRGTLR